MNRLQYHLNRAQALADIARGHRINAREASEMRDLRRKRHESGKAALCQTMADAHTERAAIERALQAGPPLPVPWFLQRQAT